MDGVIERQLLCHLMAAPCTEVSLAERSAISMASVRSVLEALHAAGLPLCTGPDGAWHLTDRMDLLDRRTVLDGLHPDSRDLLDELAVAWQVDSTNARLIAATPLEATGAHLLIAEGQTVGRGRQGRTWVSPLCRHIYLSLSCPVAGGWAAMGGLSLAVGVMVARALESCGACGIGLKWPNDLFTAQGKLGGVLIESSGAMRGPARATVGIGINVHDSRPAGDAISQDWDWLDRATGRWIDRNALVVAMIDQLLPGIDRFQQEGLAPFLADYAKRDVLAGQAIWIDNGQGARQPGTALGVADDGSLRVCDADGERRLYAGEVSVRLQ